MKYNALGKTQPNIADFFFHGVLLCFSIKVTKPRALLSAILSLQITTFHADNERK